MKLRIPVVLLALFALLLSSCAAKKAGPPVYTTLVETTRSWDGEELPYYPDGQPKITVLRVTIPPGTTLDPHYHPVINTAVMLRGSLTVVDQQDNSLVLNKGDTLVELVNKIHYGKNEGNRPVELLIFYAGTNDLPLAVKEKAN